MPFAYGVYNSSKYSLCTTDIVAVEVLIGSKGVFETLYETIKGASPANSTSVNGSVSSD